jgi:hypothetical protein
MGTKLFRSLLAATAVLVTVPAMAHDPSEHMDTAEKPDCTAMNDRGHEEMNTNDPVVQAMMKKCMNAMHTQGMSTKGESMESPVPDELMTKQAGSHDHHGG